MPLHFPELSGVTLNAAMKYVAGVAWLFESGSVDQPDCARPVHVPPVSMPFQKYSLPELTAGSVQMYEGSVTEIWRRYGSDIGYSRTIAVEAIVWAESMTS